LREVASHAYLSHIRRFYEREEVYSYFDDFFGFVGAIDRGLLLDCGSGTGHVSQRLNELGIDTCVLSLDVNLHLLSYARDTRNLEFPLRADVFDLPLRDCTVTGVVLLDVIEHLEQPLKALREIRRVMVRGGEAHLDHSQWSPFCGAPQGPPKRPDTCARISLVRIESAASSSLFRCGARFKLRYSSFESIESEIG
jgi:SAM-dependent methyltransferase